jgi:multidrug resistance efflux pump
VTHSPIEDAAAITADTAADPDTENAPKRPMKRSTRTALMAIGIASLVAILVLAWVYLIEARKYVSTDNAQIDGDKIAVNAPASGRLVDWTATQGSQLKKDEVVGRIRMEGGFVQPQQAIRAPGDGAVAYDLSRIYITARVEETDVEAVRPGQVVDIRVDAFSDFPLLGTVRDVQGGAAGEFSPFPQSNTAANFQKVTQVIPVKIAIEDTKGLSLVPGMNVTVKIHKDN